MSTLALLGSIFTVTLSLNGRIDITGHAHAFPETQSDLSSLTAAGAGLYGIYFNGDLVNYDTKTGNMTTIAQPKNADNPMTGQSLGCMDTINGIYFFIYQEETTTWTGLYAYNMKDPTKTYSPIKLSTVFPNNDVGANDACTQNPLTGEIYIWGHDEKDQTLQVLLTLKFDPDTGNATMSTLNTYQDICNGIPEDDGYMATYDTKRDYLWLPGTDSQDAPSYFSIDAKTGKLNNTIESVSLDELLDSAEYEAKNDVIVGLYTIGKHNNSEEFFDFRLTYFDAVTLEPIKSFDTIPGEYCGWTPIYALDEENGIYYQLMFTLNNKEPRARCNNPNDMIGNLVGLSVNDGTIVSNAKICDNVFDCPWDLQYWSG